MKRLHIILTLVVLSFSACATQKIPDSQRVSADRNSWIGTWLSPNRSYFGYESSNGVQINPDGTGYMITSALFEPVHNPSFVVKQTDFNWQPSTSSSIQVKVTSRRFLAGSSTMSIFGKRDNFEMIMSDLGLRVDGMAMQKAIFLKYEKLPTDLATSITNETMALSEARKSGTTTNSTYGQRASNQLLSY